MKAMFLLCSISLLLPVSLASQTPKPRKTPKTTETPEHPKREKKKSPEPSDTVRHQTGGPLLVPAEEGKTVYDRAQNVTWLADGNYAKREKLGVKGIADSGAMGYKAAVAWVGQLNARKYLGHSNWSLPISPKTDSTCKKSGPYGNAFGFGCRHSALGSLYHNGLGIREPNTVVRMPPSTFKSFRNFQPYLYWAGPLSEHGGRDKNPNANGYVSFSFASGYKGSNVAPNFLYVLPMIGGRTRTPAPAGTTVYEEDANVTWLADANLAASQKFGVDSINEDGAMDHPTAVRFVAAMNAYNGGKGWLGQTNWELPTAIYPDTATNCTQPNFGFRCTGSPMGMLYYKLLGLRPGDPVVPTPDVAVGPFHDIQPYLYWSCLGAKGVMTCGDQPAADNFQFSFSFGNGFQGTDYLQNDLYVMVYYPGPPGATEQTVRCAPGRKCPKAPM